jgi:hypothetical protein
VYRTLSRSLQRIRKKLIDYGPSHFPPSRSAQPNGPRADEDERLSETKNAAAISFPFTVETVERAAFSQVKGPGGATTRALALPCSRGRRGTPCGQCGHSRPGSITGGHLFGALPFWRMQRAWNA